MVAAMSRALRDKDDERPTANLIPLSRRIRVPKRGFRPKAPVDGGLGLGCAKKVESTVLMLVSIKTYYPESVG